MKPEGSFYSDAGMKAGALSYCEELERSKANVRQSQLCTPELTCKANHGGMVQCDGCLGWYEDATGNFCSFCT